VSGASDDRGGTAARAAARFEGLDALRFVAAAMVVLFHFGFLYRVAAPGFSRPWPELAPYAVYGHLGVQLFFFISGFLVLRTARGRTWPGFLRARVVRLYPAYLACCLLTFVAASVWSMHPLGMNTLLYNLTMQNGLIDRWLGRPSVFVDGSYWTLAFEWQFYFGVAILLAFAQLPRIEPWLWAWLAATALHAVSPWRPLEVAAMAPWSAYFIVGAAMYLIRTDGATAARAGLLLLALGLCGLHTARLTRDITEIHATPVDVGISMAIVLAGFSAFALATHATQRASGRTARVLALAGALSYPLYLLHARLGEIAVERAWTPASRWPLLAAMVVGVVLLAWLVNVAVEGPIWRRLRREVRGSGMRG
jgi:peptidoglycan/LPS O-acetylase OafA/YrhL